MRLLHRATCTMAEVPLPTPTDNAVPSTDIRDAVYAGAMLDKVVTSTELTYTDRLGGEHYTVDGIKAEGDKVVEETRQNLIPLSKQYMTIEAAQADIANIPAGSTTYVRSQDGSSLADEYINLAGTLQPTGRRMLRDDYGYQVSPDSVALAGYDPETKRVAPFLNTNGRLIQIGPDGKYYELLTQQESELYALGREGSVPQFIGGEKVWRMTVDSTTNQIVEAYTVGGKHWIYSDGGLVAVNNGSGGGGGDDDANQLPEYGLHLSGSTVYPYSEDVPVCFIFVTAGQSNARGYCPDADQTIVAATPVYPDNAFMLSGGVRRTGTRSTTLVPLVEAVSGTDKETAASGLANTFIRDMYTSTGVMPRTLSIVCAQSGQAYEYQKRGNQVYQYLLDSIEDCVTACKAKGWLPIVLCVDWMQGESDEKWSGLREGMYESRMKQYQRQVISDIMARTGQKEPPIIAQTQIGYVNDNHGAFTGQYVRMSVNKLHGHEQFRCVNTLYQYDFISDGLHLTCAAQNKRGAAVARAIVQEWFTSGWYGMVPSGFVWNSPTQIQINIPSYTNLKIDTTNISTDGLANYGFNYTDESASPPAVSSVAISSDGKGVLINLASAPTGRFGRVSYATVENPLQSGATVKPSGRTLGARGCVRSSAGITWVYDTSVTLYDWLPAFRINVF
ncbi:flagellar biosynthesis, cell-distal portion of basal-body rod [Klebsiella pneumoniae]|nr:flagellar biosynthesis, cell-distal portion of basal-body rod [Klebsiella pneumoniae]SSN69898.1 flagellar biosynthesis, cell-distal portion of basal-body rod [Klebsiella pneumoniae]